jgi:tRNA dimethylallyltransferase
MSASTQNSHPALLTFTGPTAVGKSDLALRLAAEFNAEIVSTDSRQVYIGMDIATAKPSVEEQTATPHHLIDLITPDQPYSLGLYQGQAYSAIDDILARGKLPLLVGGTPQYVYAVVEGWIVPAIAPNEELRQRLYAADPAALYSELEQRDPVAAAKILPGNVRRVIRALEVLYTSGQPISAQQRKQSPRYRQLRIALSCERTELYRRADARVEQMIERGLVAEVQALHDAGYSLDLPSMSGIGYRQIGVYLSGQSSLEAAIERIKLDTHSFIRHQYSWFRRDAELHWFDNTLGQPYDEVVRLIREFLSGDQVGSGHGDNIIPNPLGNEVKSALRYGSGANAIRPDAYTHLYGEAVKAALWYGSRPNVINLYLFLRISWLMPVKRNPPLR